MIDELTAKIKGHKTENELTREQVTSCQNDKQVLNAKIASLKADLAKIRRQPPVTRSLTPRKRLTPLTLIHKYNENGTRLRLTSGDYNMVKIGRPEKVNGKWGQYYNIALRDPTNGKAYHFASASYSRINDDRSFKQSLDRVISDIRGAFDGKRDYQIYVQGKASASTYSGRLAPDFKYTTIKLLERDADGNYGPQLVERHYGPIISNKDLPNLRAAFLQDYVSKYYKVARPIILDGKVAKSTDISNQAVALTLFVAD